MLTSRCEDITHASNRKSKPSFQRQARWLDCRYWGIGTDLKKALSFYEAGGKGDPAENIEKAFEIFKEKLEIIQQMFNRTVEQEKTF